MKTLGLCLGASTISIVGLNYAAGKPEITDYSLHPHEGNPKKTLLKALATYNLKAFDRIGVTGRKFR